MKQISRRDREVLRLVGTCLATGPGTITATGPQNNVLWSCARFAWYKSKQETRHKTCENQTSGRAKRETAKGRNRTRNAHFRIFADFRWFSARSVNQGIWESQICAGNGRKPQIFAGNRRKPQKPVSPICCLPFGMLLKLFRSYLSTPVFTEQSWERIRDRILKKRVLRRGIGVGAKGSREVTQKFNDVQLEIVLPRNPENLKVARLQSESWHVIFLSSFKMSYGKCSKFFWNYWAFILWVRKNPANFPTNCKKFPSKVKENHGQASGARGEENQGEVPDNQLFCELLRIFPWPLLLRPQYPSSGNSHPWANTSVGGNFWRTFRTIGP